MDRTRRSWILGAVALAALCAALAWAFAPRPVRVEVHPVARGLFEETVDEEGVMRVRERYVVAAPVAGRLDRIALDVGDAVQAGDVVAVLRPSPPSLQDARTVSLLRERVGAAQAGKARSDANVARAQAALAQARLEAERAEKLAGQGFASKGSVDEARSLLEQRAQEHRAAVHEQDALGHELAMARAALAQGESPASSTRSVRVEVRAPERGRVLKVVQESEAPVAAGAPLIEIGDPESIEAEVDVLSQDAVRIAPGMSARMRVSPAAPEFAGIVRRVEPTARTKVSALGVEEQRVHVIVDAQSPGVQVGDAYRIDASIVVLARDTVLLAPVGALFRDGDGWAVFVASDGRAKRRRVELGGRNQRVAWVTDGLSEADRVIVYPSDAVRDGVRVAAR